MLPLGLVPGVILAQIINFIILMLVLRTIAYGPLLNMLQQRKERIAKGLEDARKAEERLANIEKDYQAKLDQARVESQRMMAERTEAADQQAAAIIAKANEDVARIRQQAQADAGLERNRILADMRSQVAALSMAAANKVVGATLDEQRQQSLINEFFSGVKTGKIIVVDPGRMAGKVVVTSALPLSDAEQSSIKSDLTSRGASDVSFQVDPSILGGLVLRVGDRVVDGSVAGKLEALRQSLV